jgi:hypothetical protein
MSLVKTPPANEPVNVTVAQGKAHCVSPIAVDAGSILAFALDPAAVQDWRFSAIRVPTGFLVVENSDTAVRLQVPFASFSHRVNIRLKKNHASAGLPPDETEVDPEVKTGPKD